MLGLRGLDCPSPITRATNNINLSIFNLEQDNILFLSQIYKKQYEFMHIFHLEQDTIQGPLGAKYVKNNMNLCIFNLE